MNKNRIHIIHNAFDIFYLLIGPAIAAVGIALFYTPAKITSGGASGVANILYNLFGFDLGLVSFLVNLPLITVGVFVFGFKYSIKTFIGSSLLSLWVLFVLLYQNGPGLRNILFISTGSFIMLCDLCLYQSFLVI